MKQRLIDAFPEEELLFADGFDDAIIGIDEQTLRIIYSVGKCIEILENEMADDAIEYFDFNVRGAYVGEKTPIWCDDCY